jgi:serpin B
MKKSIAILPLLLCKLVFAADSVPWNQADFAADLYRSAALASGANANVILSPWGVGSLFGMLQTGARGDTARGMAAALRLGADEPAPEETAAAFREARAALSAATNANVALELSDSLWLAPGFSPSEDFLALVREAFDAEARTTPMGETGRTAINQFVSGKTHGRIPEVLSPGSLDDPFLRLVAVDTIYLKAKWQEPFDAAETQDRAFHADSGDVQTPFMHGEREAEILDAPECAVLRLPYKGLSVEMLVFLPSPSNTVADVEALLGGPFLDRLAASPWQGKVSIALPKFEFDSSHDLKPILSAMGMDAAFSPLDADFSGIAPQLYLSAALQKANVTVDEEGTEAAAATVAIGKANSAWPPPPQPRPFVADRPFLFLIREMDTGLVLFLGRVAKPAYTPKTVPSYTVRFDANGGKLPQGKTMAPQTFPCGDMNRLWSMAKLRKNVFTRKGCVFAGWAKSKKGPVEYGDAAFVPELAVADGSVTLYAQWAAENYTVAFDANGGTGRMPAQAMTYEKAAKLSKNAFKRKDCIFLGWAKSRSGAASYANRESVKNLRTDGKTTTLYAKWAKKEYTVAFDANGGKGKMDAQAMTYGEPAKLRRNAFSMKGCVFTGWGTAKNGPVAYADRQEVRNLRRDGQTTTLYARWAKETSTVKFNANGGTVSPASKTVKYNARIGSRPKPQKAGCKFVGWYTAKTGGTKVLETTRVTASCTLYAHWTAAAKSVKRAAPPAEENPAGAPPAEQAFSTDDCGVFGVGTREIEISPEPPEIEELGGREWAEELETPLALTFRVPEGGAAWQLWSAARGTLADEGTAAGTVTLELPDLYVWYWMRFLDAEGSSLSSTWLFPAE